MGSFHWSKRRKTCNSSSRFHEWAMKNSSDQFLPATRIHAPAQQQQQQHPGDPIEEETARCEWDFSLKSVVSSTSGAGVSDAIGVIEFDPSEKIVATGGIARKIRIYAAERLFPGEDDVVLMDHANACEFFICTPAKLSSLRWRPGSESRVIAAADYDGVVMEYDLERRVPVFERDEHGGRRVWSVDYSHSGSGLVGASGSDDGTMQVWDPRCESGGCVATVDPSQTRRAVCCVEFNPFGGPIIAVGCADRRGYGYDLRMMVKPVLTLDGHGKTVTYARFVDNDTLATSAIDGCLKLWDLNSSKTVRSYKGHTNTRNFVGLSVQRNGGLLGCGSENNQVFVYDKRWGDPIWVHGRDPVGLGSDNRVFVSSVCWSQVGVDKCNFVAGGSDGTLQIFQGSRKPYTSG